MATAHVTGPGAGSGPIKDDSMSAADGNRAAGDLSQEIADQEQVLQMVEAGFDPDRIFESREYQFSMDMLQDSKLKGNMMYEKLTQRLSAFYLNTEKIRVNGLTDLQQSVIRKSGFSQEYRIKLYKCLRDLLIHIVNERKIDLKLRQLRHCYEWFFEKLVAMGALSEEEIRAENEFLNPLAN